MPGSELSVDAEQHFVLSNLAPGSAQKRTALAIVLGLLIALYLITGPFSQIQLAELHAFVAIYATAMFVTDSITAILLCAQSSILRSRGVLVIASGYLFTALIVVLYLLAFPGVMAPNGLIGDVQTSAWLYVIWHSGFALFVIAYALTKDGSSGRIGRGIGDLTILWAVVGTFLLAAAAGIVATKGTDFLPKIMVTRTRFSPDWPYIVGAPITLLCAGAIVTLWVRRRTVLDLWLMVVMFLYLVEVPLSWYPTPARFSTGWYAVRVVGFISSSLVLTVLLYEITKLYAKLLTAVLGQRREREARLMTGDAVAASIAHEIRQPLTAMVTTADAGLRFLDRSVPNMDRAKEAFRRIAADGLRAGTLVGNIRANFKSDVKDRSTFDIADVISETLDLGGAELRKHRIVVRAEPNKLAPPVHGNRVQLQQVLLNLMMNAIDSMAAEDEPRVLSLAIEAHEREFVLISVSDTGAGVAPPDLERMFDPLFTTKSNGMGMGLSICRAIVEAHGGRLWFSPNHPQGAVFHFTVQAGESPSVLH